LWDVTFRTAVAQAELEDRERDSAYHAVTFHRSGGDVITIETTRPELIPACVALVADPDDERYQPLFGSTVRTPLFDVEVPVLAHHLARGTDCLRPTSRIDCLHCEADDRRDASREW
jgi:valyl-tRNA synthetase